MQEETSCLFESFGTETWDLFWFQHVMQSHHFPHGRQRCAEMVLLSRHVWQGRYAVTWRKRLTRSSQRQKSRFSESFFWLTSWLVLAYSGWFRVNLNRSANGSLETTGNRNGRAFSTVKSETHGEPTLMQSRPRGTAFIDNDVRSFLRNRPGLLPQKLHFHGLLFPVTDLNNTQWHARWGQPSF